MSVQELLIPNVETISPDETVMSARRRMESQTIRSLIVVEDDRPVGVVTWRVLGHHAEATPVRDVMLTNVPTLSVDTPIDALGDFMAAEGVDFDRIPVVDADGVLVGEVLREAVMKRVTTTDEATRPLQSMSEADEATTGPALHIEHGMEVVGPSDHRLGTVEQVEVSSEGAISGFSVRHGRHGHHVKRLPVDVIVGVRDRDLLVTIGEMEFDRLADIEA